LLREHNGAVDLESSYTIEEYATQDEFETAMESRSASGWSVLAIQRVGNGPIRAYWGPTWLDPRARLGGPVRPG